MPWGPIILDYLEFWDTPNLSWKTRRNKNKRLDITQKVNLPSSEFCYLGGPHNENKRKWKINKYFDLAKELKTMEHEDDCGTNCSLCSLKQSPKSL